MFHFNEPKVFRRILLQLRSATQKKQKQTTHSRTSGLDNINNYLHFRFLLLARMAVSQSIASCQSRDCLKVLQYLYQCLAEFVSMFHRVCLNVLQSLSECLAELVSMFCSVQSLSTPWVLQSGNSSCTSSATQSCS